MMDKPYFILFFSLVVLSSCSPKDPTDKDKHGSVTLNDSIPKVEDHISTDTVILLDKRISVYIPKFFFVMDDKRKAVKYPRGAKPDVVYTNDDFSVNFGVSHSMNPATFRDLPQILGTLSSQLGASPDLKWYKKEIIKINNREFISMEFETPTIDGLGKIYNMMFITVLEGRLLINSFNFPASKREVWEPFGVKIRESFIILSEG